MDGMYQWYNISYVFSPGWIFYLSFALQTHSFHWARRAHTQSDFPIENSATYPATSAIGLHPQFTLLSVRYFAGF
ncbi:hypothetical protein B0H19DRAFT_1273669 [Mycena capillaripes]|nr:hypothetical protein B0H19DRAFT_1273669 [Mycena capillaripes]